MAELFIVGTFAFWLLVAIEIILLFVFMENENGLGASISVAVFLCLLQWAGNVDIINYIRTNPLFMLSCLAAYFALGAVWGTIKWWVYCRDLLEHYEQAKADFFRSKNVPVGTKVVPVELRVEWKKKIEDLNYRRSVTERIHSEPPQVRENKAKIMRWMTFWVISLIWSVIHDFVKRVFKTIYYRMASILQRISDNLFGSVKADLEMPPEEPQGRSRDA